MDELPDNVIRLEDRRGKLNIVADSSGLYATKVQAVIIEHYSHYQALLTLMSYLQNGVRIVCPDVILRVIPEPPSEPPAPPEPFRPEVVQGGGKPSVWSRIRGLFRPPPRGGAVTEKKNVKLYAVGWKLNRSKAQIYADDAVETQNGYRAVNKHLGAGGGYDSGSAFSYRARVTKEERADLRIGLSPEEAVDFAVADIALKREKALKEVDVLTQQVLLLLALEPKYEPQADPAEN